MGKGRSLKFEEILLKKVDYIFCLFLVTPYNLMLLIALSVNNVICFRSGGCDSKELFNCLVDKRNSQSSQ